MACTLYGQHQLALVLCARPRYALGNNFPLFAYKTLQSFFIFVINVNIFVVAELARSFFSGSCIFGGCTARSAARTAVAV